MRYPLFISNFKHILRVSWSPRTAYLIQHCQGEAKQLIEFCTILSAEAGYKGLVSYYMLTTGNRGQLREPTSIAFLKEPTYWKNLVKLSHDLEECDATLNDLGR